MKGFILHKYKKVYCIIKKFTQNVWAVNEIILGIYTNISFIFKFK